MVIHTGKFKGYHKRQESLSADDLRALLMDGPALLPGGTEAASGTISAAELAMLLDRDNPLPVAHGSGFRLVDGAASATLF